MNSSVLDSGVVSAIGSWSPTRSTPDGSCSRSLADCVLAKAQVATPSRTRSSAAKIERLIILPSRRRREGVLVVKGRILIQRANRYVSGLRCTHPQISHVSLKLPPSFAESPEFVDPRKVLVKTAPVSEYLDKMVHKPVSLYTSTELPT